MRIVNLNKKEIDFLKTAKFLSNDLQIIVSSVKKDSSKYQLELPEEKIDVFRDIFGDQLEMCGFDEHYVLNKEGEILESLIDKFYFD